MTEINGLTQTPQRDRPGLLIDLLIISEPLLIHKNKFFFGGRVQVFFPVFTLEASLRRTGIRLFTL